MSPATVGSLASTPRTPGVQTCFCLSAVETSQPHPMPDCTHHPVTHAVPIAPSRLKPSSVCLLVAAAHWLEPLLLSNQCHYHDFVIAGTPLLGRAGAAAEPHLRHRRGAQQVVCTCGFTSPASPGYASSKCRPTVWFHCGRRARKRHLGATPSGTVLVSIISSVVPHHVVQLMAAAPRERVADFIHLPLGARCSGAGPIQSAACC